jgi:hypothetical protein
MEVGCVRDGLLLHPFPHPSLAMDLVAEEPNAWKSATDKTHSYHMGKEEFVEKRLGSIDPLKEFAPILLL